MNKLSRVLAVCLIVFSFEAYGANKIQIDMPKTSVFAGAPGLQGGSGIQSEGTGSMIEDRLFKILLDAYQRRDEQQFLKFYAFYLKSFPSTPRKALLLEYRTKFFYSEALDVYKLGGALVDMRFPAAKTWREMKKMFRQFKEDGMKIVQVKMSQRAGEPVFLFSTGSKHQGYFFPTSSGPVATDMLSKLAKLAHKNDMKLYVSFSTREQPGLDHLPVLMIDQSYNSISSEVKYNGKLDLLHPKALDHLLNLTEGLTKLKVDGLVIEDNFTYAPQEGFSSVARRRFKLDTGIDLDMANLLVSYEAKGDFGVEGYEEYQVYLEWRSRQIRQLLWDLVTKTKQMRADFPIGLEVTPEMLTEDTSVSTHEYSTAFNYLWDLPVDFLVLKWSKSNHDGESDPEEYDSALKRLIKKVNLKTLQIYLKVPLNKQTENVILLNDRIKKNLAWMQEEQALKQAIGPIDRRKSLDFLHHRVVEKLHVEEVE